MCNELDQKSKSALQTMMNVEVLPVTPEVDLEMHNATKVRLADLSALGVAFQSLTAAVQTLVTGSGGSGIYFVDTMGKQMFHANGSADYIGALMSPNGGVGGGQARMTALPCDPTMLFMAFALMNIEKKLDAIHQTQEEILQFLEEKERATLQGNLNVLGEVLTNFKYNWDNAQYKTNKHILVQDIKRKSEASIILYRDQIGKSLQKRIAFHGDMEVKNILKRVQTQFKDYQLALYLYAYSAFLEVMLLGNYSEGYLSSIEQRIAEYAYQYRALYTECYNRLESYSNSTVQAEMLGGLASASKFMGNVIAKVPGISESQLDETLIETGNKLGTHNKQRAAATLSALTQIRRDVTVPFVENIRMVNNLYNKPTRCLMDKDGIYIQQFAG